MDACMDPGRLAEMGLGRRSEHRRQTRGAGVRIGVWRLAAKKAVGFRADVVLSLERCAFGQSSFSGRLGGLL